MDASRFASVLGILVGAWSGYSLVRHKRGVLRVSAHLALYVVVAILAGFGGALLARFDAGFSRAYALGRGISEGMNCLLYGLIAGVVAACITAAWRRRRGK